jgi:hypothetical protein
MDADRGQVALARRSSMSGGKWRFRLTALASTRTPSFRDGIFEMEFDFVDRSSSCARAMDGHDPSAQTTFGRRFLPAPHHALGALGIEFHIRPLPVEVPGAIPFDADQVHAAYDPAYAHRWWLILTQIEGVLQQYRSSFVGKSSPVQFFWGSFDLNETRFSGRPATPPQGAPRLAARGSGGIWRAASGLAIVGVRRTGPAGVLRIHLSTADPNRHPCGGVATR